MSRTTPPQPTPAEREAARRQNESLRKVRVTPKEGKVIDSANRSEGGGKKKGGMIMKKSDKAGRALVKKSADTMGRAMMKKAGGGKCYAKGGSIDGVAKKGHTKAKQVKMAGGGLTLGTGGLRDGQSITNSPRTLGDAPVKMLKLPSRPAKKMINRGPMGMKKGGKC
jgi:hypothetical protein